MTGKSGGTTFDDPNREAIGLAPIWTGAGETPVEPEPEPEPDPEPETETTRKGKSSK